MSILDIIARAAVAYVLEEDRRTRPSIIVERPAPVIGTSAAAKVIRGMSAKDAYFDSDKEELAEKIVKIVNAHIGDAEVVDAALDKLNELRAACRFSSTKSDIYDYITAIATGELPVEV